MQEFRLDAMLHAGQGFPWLLLLTVAAADNERCGRVATQPSQASPLHEAQHARHERCALPERFAVRRAAREPAFGRLRHILLYSQRGVGDCSEASRIGNWPEYAVTVSGNA